MKLSPTAVYTTVAPETVFEASRGDDCSEVLHEKKRWVTALRMFQRARREGLVFPIFFSDGRNCAELVYWASLEDLRVTDDGTYYTFSRLQGLHDCYTQDLVLTSEKRHIAPHYIRPYALVQTPDFVYAASMDAEQRYVAQMTSEREDVDWDQPELVQHVAFELEEDWWYVFDQDGDVSRRPQVRRRGQALEKVLTLALERQPGFYYDFDQGDEGVGVYRWPLIKQEVGTGGLAADRPRLRSEALDSAEKQPLPLTVFSWGYAGWGSSVPQLLEVTEAAERARGFQAPVFVDVRFSRSVRAPGFRERTFESSLPAGRYHWMKGLGNEGIASGGGLKIYRPEEAARLLDLALEEWQRSRRLLFFCSCESPEFCHRNSVRDLLLSEAKNRGLELAVAEWPGGEPANEVVCSLKVPSSVFARILDGASRIPIEAGVALDALAAHAWGGYVEITDGKRAAIASVGPAKYSAGAWFVEPFVTPVEEDDQVANLTAAVRKFRAEGNYRVFAAETKRRGRRAQ